MSEDSQEARPSTAPAYPLGLVLRCAALAAVVFAVFAVALLLALDVELTGSYAEAIEGVDTAAGRVAAFILPGAVLCIALLALGCALFGVRASHKIAGPVYRLSTDMHRMASGDYGFDVSTRRKDQLRDVAEELEQARDQMARKLWKAKECAEHLDRALAQENPPWDEIRERLASLEEALSDTIGRQEDVSQ